MAQSVKRPTLGFSSGRGLAVRGLKPRIVVCVDSGEPVWDSLSPPLSLSLFLSLCLSPARVLSVKINK